MTTAEILPFIGILCITSIPVYINLYILIPQFFNTKKYIHYFGFLILIIMLAALVIPFIDENNTLIFIGNFINILIFIVITSGLKFITDNQKNQVKIKELENMRLNAELSILKSQINPHFLFNSLNNLYGLVLKNKNQIAAETILNLSGLMRYILEKNNLTTTTLSEEIKFIESYIKLEKIRLPKAIDIKFEMSVEKKEIEIPPLLFIPMVENAFKHGVAHHIESGFAHFSLTIQKDELYFQAENSLSNRQIAKEEISGRGLINLQKRLEILYPKKHSLSIEKSNKTYKILLILNL